MGAQSATVVDTQRRRGEQETVGEKMSQIVHTSRHRVTLGIHPAADGV